jgi:O-antigen/teichoic acid export membrane protein
MPWLAIILTLDSLYYPAQNVIFLGGRTKLIPVVTASSTLVGLGLSALLLPPFGIAGLLAARTAASLGQMLWLSHLARSMTELPREQPAVEAPVSA